MMRLHILKSNSSSRKTIAYIKKEIAFLYNFKFFSLVLLAVLRVRLGPQC